MKILIRNIKTLVQVREKSAGKVRGALMRDLPCLDNAWLLIKDGLIAGYGKMETLPGQEHPGVDISIDASGRLVFHVGATLIHTSSMPEAVRRNLLTV